MLAAALLAAAPVAAQVAHAPAPAKVAPFRLPDDAPTLSPDSRDVVPYLSYFQARAAERSSARALAMTSNQQAWDARAYDLDLNPDLVTGVLTATVRVQATVTAGPISSLDLDFDSSAMHVDGATSAGAITTFVHAANLLTVQLDRWYSSGETVDVTVAYHGSPAATGFGSYGVAIYAGKPILWTLSEPFGAHSWWPCKDQPADKADSVDVRVTLPTGMITAGNGVRLEHTDNGTTAFSHWRERHPISTYLVSMTSYAYGTFSDWYRPAPTDSMEIQFFYYPDQLAANTPVSLKIKDMIAAYAARFGPYAFLDEKYGQAQFPWGGGMENQTCTSLGNFNEWVVAHELGHQWWGDLVTCRDFHHIWLNEGFATYCQALWSEASVGESAYHADMQITKYWGGGTVYRPDLSTVGAIFDGGLSYAKGSWVLHMLRHVLGDSTFFASLRAYRAAHAYSNATTEDLRAACEATSGIGLGKFFQQWIYGEYYPKYEADWTSSPAAGGVDVTVRLRQVQDWQKFWMPVDLHLATPAGDTTIVARDSLDTQFFTVTLAAAPTAIDIDPGDWILCLSGSEVSVPRVGAISGLALAPPAPNPSRGGTAIDFTLPRAGVARVRVLDLAGRAVATVHDGLLSAGAHHLEWSGTDGSGRPALAGIYWVSVEQDGARVTRRVARLR